MSSQKLNGLLCTLPPPSPQQVGNYPGRALSFAASLAGGGNGSGAEPRLLSLPGKREGLFATAGAPHLIARSDSNGGGRRGRARA